MGLPPIHEEFETYGIDIYHFESCKIKEGREDCIQVKHSLQKYRKIGQLKV